MIHVYHAHGGPSGWTDWETGQSVQVDDPPHSLWIHAEIAPYIGANTVMHVYGPYVSLSTRSGKVWGWILGQSERVEVAIVDCGVWRFSDGMWTNYGREPGIVARLPDPYDYS